MHEAPTSRNTGGVVVTYNPDDGLAERVLSLAKHVDRVLVVDNGSQARPLATVRRHRVQPGRRVGSGKAASQTIYFRRGAACDATWAVLARLPGRSNLPTHWCRRTVDHHRRRLMPDLFSRLMLDPHPLRSFVRKIVRKLELGNYEQRLGIAAVERPWYGYIVYQGAALAKRLGYQRVSVLEFGVAGGNGLLNLEHHAEQASRAHGIAIDIYGFDTAQGLPEPVDYRDLPYHWKRGFYGMDLAKMQARLTTARLVLGDITETSQTFFDKYRPAPIAAIAHDFDFYSSTAVALRMLEANERFFLPRVFSYFDDIIGTEIELYNDYTGERLAIKEFNDAHEDVKIAPLYYLLANKFVEPWYHQLRICHFFRHGEYNRFVSAENQQNPVP
jgi:hypothetical protein